MPLVVLAWLLPKATNIFMRLSRARQGVMCEVVVIRLPFMKKEGSIEFTVDFGDSTSLISFHVSVMGGNVSGGSVVHVGFKGGAHVNFVSVKGKVPSPAGGHEVVVKGDGAAVSELLSGSDVGLPTI